MWSNYCLPKGYQHHADPALHIAGADALTRQGNVYQEASRIVRNRGYNLVVDLGCGNGLKLVHYFLSAQTVGVDTGANLAAAKREYPKRTWLNIDLDAPFKVSVGTAPRPFVICADVIEHLRQPEHLLTGIKSLLASGGEGLLSTPDRALYRGADHLGPPPNRRHVREWTLREFVDLLTAAGLIVVEAQHMAANTGDSDKRTIVVRVKGAS